MRLKLFLSGFGIAVASILVMAQQPTTIAHFTATTSNVSGAGDTIRIDILKWSTDADRDQFLNAWTHPAPTTPVAPAAPPAATPDAGAPPRGGGGARGGGARGAGGGAAGAARGIPPAAGGAVAPPLPAVAAVPPDGATPPAPDAAAPRGGGRGGGARGATGNGGAPAGRGAAPAAAPEAPVDTPESTLLAALQKANTVGILWTSESAGYSLKYAYRVMQPGGGERIIFATDRRLGAWSDQWWKPTSGAPTNLSFTVFEIRFPATGEGEGRTTLTAKIVEDSAAKSISVENYAAQPVVFKGVKKAK